MHDTGSPPCLWLTAMLNRKLGFLNSFEAARLLWFPNNNWFMFLLSRGMTKKATVIRYVLFLGPLHDFSCFAKPLSGNAFQKHTLSSTFQMPSAFYLSGWAFFHYFTVFPDTSLDSPLKIIFKILCLPWPSIFQPTIGSLEITQFQTFSCFSGFFSQRVGPLG